MNQILESAEVKASSLYHHFPDGKQDVAPGDEIVPGGRPLRPQDLGMLAAAGVTSVAVHGKPVVTIFSTGDEVVPPGTAELKPGQVRDASARVFGGWCLAVADRLRADGWTNEDAEQTALAVIALLEGALILSRIAGDASALNAAKAAARTLLSPASGAHGAS